MAKLSYLSGTSDIPLLGITIGDKFDEIAMQYSENEAFIIKTFDVPAIPILVLSFALLLAISRS